MNSFAARLAPASLLALALGLAACTTTLPETAPPPPLEPPPVVTPAPVEPPAPEGPGGPVSLGGLPGPTSDLALGPDGALYAAAAEGVYRRAGTSWLELGGRLSGASAVAVSGAEVYAGAGGQVYRLSGGAWEPAASGLPGGGSVESLAVAGNVLHAGGPWGVYRLANARWTRLNAGLPSTWVRDLAAGGSGELYAASWEETPTGEVEGGVSRLAPGAGSWTKAGAGLGPVVHDLALGPDGTLYASEGFDGFAVYRLAKAGWTETPRLPGGEWGSVVDALAVDGAGRVYAGSTEDGRAWVRRLERGAWSDAGGPPVGPLSALLAAGGEVLAGGVGGVDRLGADGRTWASLGSAGLPGRALALALEPGGGLVAGTNLGAYRLSPGGASWARLGPGEGGPVSGLEFDRAGNLYAFAERTSPYDGGAYRLPPGGGAWTELGGPGEGRDFAVDADGNLYTAGFDPVGGGRGAFRLAAGSPSFGRWEPLGSGLPVDSSTFLFSMARAKDGTLYAGLGGVIGGAKNPAYRLPPGGKRWEGLATGLPAGFVRALVMDATGALYAGLAGSSSGVYRLTGTSWRAVGGALPSVAALAFDAQNRPHAATSGAVYRLENDAWTPVFDRPALALAFDPGGRLLVGTVAGVYRVED